MNNLLKPIIISLIFVIIPFGLFQVFIKDFGWVFWYYVVILPIIFTGFVVAEKDKARKKHSIVCYAAAYLIVLVFIYLAIKNAFSNSSFPF